MKKIFLIIILAGILCNACKKLATADLPPNQLTYDKVFSDTSSLSAAVGGLFIQLGTVNDNLVRNISLYTDELKTTSVSSTDIEFSNSSLTVTNNSVLSIWQNLYSTIYNSNEIASALEKSTSVPVQAKNMALGESRFIRAYCYLYLTRLYGDVPILLTTNIQINASSGKNNAKEVLLQAISDFDAADKLLSVDYPLNNGKTTGNRYAACAYLSQACLEAGLYSRADSAATAVIDAGNYALLTDLNAVWTENNNEAIFQLWNQYGFSTLNLVTTSGVPANQLTNSLYSTFTADDLRKSAWIGNINTSGANYFFPYKYKQHSMTSGPSAEYSTVMRLAEVYLMRSEARTRNGNLTGGMADLKIVRTRAGLSPLILNTKNDLLSAILRERQLELFNENGSRFFDLKRFGLLDQTLSPIKPMWKSTGSLFPIPQSEILNDPNLTQNPGY